MIQMCYAQKMHTPKQMKMSLCDASAAQVSAKQTLFIYQERFCCDKIIKQDEEKGFPNMQMSGQIGVQVPYCLSIENTFISKLEENYESKIRSD